MRKFQTFTRDLSRRAAIPQITVLRSGMLSLNEAARAALGDAGAVELLYEAATRVIGLRPVDTHAESACIVRHPSRGSHGPFVITAMAFTKYFEIDTRQSLRWDAFVEEGVVCICLDDPCTPVTSNRAQRENQVVPLRRPNAGGGALPQSG